jgi:rhamnosyltransferase
MELETSGVTVAVIVPTLNASKDWSAFIEGLRQQTLAPKQVIIVDSMSDDGTPDLVRAAGLTLISIERAKFNHGRTRQFAADQVTDAEFLVYLTQDALLQSPDSIARLIAPFSDSSVGATYGRQLPRPNAGPIEAHARRFNYPETSVIKSWEDRHRLGVRATFLSNSFAAYRRTALSVVGGFPSHTIMAEDALVAGHLLETGWKTAYVADALVVHSHEYTIMEEFRRYFDTGVCHSRESWLLERFGKASGEGLRFAKSEMGSLFPKHMHLLPGSLLRTAAKLIGYRLGQIERFIGTPLKRKLSMHKHFWS